MATTIQDLQNKANLVANATNVGENTAARVGGALQDAANLIAALQTQATTDRSTVGTVQTSLMNLQNAITNESSTRETKDKALQDLIAALQTQVNTLTGTNASDAIDNFNEVIAFLKGVKDDETLTALLQAIQSRISALENIQKSGYRFMGIATPDTNPGTPIFNAFYLSVKAGTYANFHTGLFNATAEGSAEQQTEVQIVVAKGELGLLFYAGYMIKAVRGWAKATIDIEDTVNAIVDKQKGVEGGLAPLEHDGLISTNYLPVDELNDMYQSNIMVSEWNDDVKPNEPIQNFEGDFGYNPSTKKLYEAVANGSGGDSEINWKEITLKTKFVYVNTEENVPYRWNGKDMIAIAAKNTPASIFNATNEVPLAAGTYYKLYDSDYTNLSAIHAAWNAKKIAPGLIISFEISEGNWKTYQYVGKTTDETNFKNPDNWQDFGSLPAGTEPVVIIDHTCGTAAVGDGYYTLATALQTLIQYQKDTGVVYMKRGLIISYSVGKGKMESKQFIGEPNDNDFGNTAAWTDFGGGGTVKTSDTPVKGGEDALTTGGAYTNTPANISASVEGTTLKLALQNADGNTIGDEQQLTLPQGGGTAGGVVVSLAFEKSPLYGAAGGEFIMKAAIRSLKTQGTTEQELNIESLQLVDRDTSEVLETRTYNQASSSDLEDYSFDWDISSYFTTAGTRRLKVVATDEEGNTGSRNLQVVSVDVAITSAQTALNYTAATALQVGGESKQIPMYQFQHNASSAGIEAFIEVYLNGSWQTFGSTIVTDTLSKAVAIDPNNVLNTKLSHGALPIRIHGEDIGSRVNGVKGTGIVGNYLYTGVMVVDDTLTTPIVVMRWYANKATATVKLYETIDIDFAVYDPTSTSPKATVYYEDAAAKSITAYRSQSYKFQQKVTGVKHDGTVTLDINTKVGNASSITAQFVVSGTLLDVEDFTTQEAFNIDLTGRSNTETDHNIADNGVAMAVDGINWDSNGFIADEDGVVGLKVAEDATALLKYAPFADGSIETNGMAIQFKIRKRYMQNDDAILMSCINAGFGFKVTGTHVIFTFDNEQTVSHTISAALQDDAAVTVAIVIEPSSQSPIAGIGIAKMYFDGEEIGACYYDAGTLVSHTTQIAFNGKDGDLWLYGIRAWKTYFGFEQAFRIYLLTMTDTDAMISENEFNAVMESVEAENTTKNRPTMARLLAKGMPCFVLCKNADTADNDAKDNYPEYLETLDGDKKTKRTLDIYAYFPDRPWQNFKAIGCSVTNQGTTSSQRPIKNIKIKFKGATITLLHPKSDFSGDEADKWQECYNNALKHRVQPKEGSIPTNIITVKVDYSESGGANNGAMMQLFNELQAALGANYTTPAQQAYTGKYHLYTSIDSVPIAFFRTDRYSKDATSPSNGYFHAKGNWNHDKGDAKVFGFEGVPGYNADCLNYGDFIELVADKGESLADFAKRVDKSTWLATDSEGNENVYVLSEFCGAGHKVYRYKNNAWTETTGNMTWNGTKWLVTGDVVNPVENYELLKYDGLDWFQGVNSVDDMLKADTDGKPIWLQYFESRYPDDDNLNDLYESGKKVPYQLYRWLHFCQECNQHLTAADGNITLNGASVSGTPANRVKKWQQELHKYANVHSVLFYDVATDYLAAVDQRSKNMMIGFYLEKDGTIRLYMNHAYDGDTINGSDNDCGLTIPVLVDPNDDQGGMYQGHDSVMFVQDNAVGLDGGFWLDDAGKNTVTKREVAAAMRQQDVGGGLIGFSPAGLQKYWITDRLSKWSKLVSSFDGERKYIEHSKATAIYLYALHGLSIQRLKDFVKTRFAFRDGYYRTGDLYTSYFSMRCTGTNISVKIRAAKDGYFAIGVDARGRYSDGAYLKAGEEYTLKTNTSNAGSGVQIWVYGADKLEMLDISNATPSPSSWDISELKLLKEFIIGGANYTASNNNEGYLSTLNLGAMPFLETLDIRNTNVTSVDAQQCPRLKSILAAGSQLQRANIATNSKVATLQFPATYKWLQLRYLPNLTNDGLTFEGMAALERMVIEDCPNFNPTKLLSQVLADRTRALKYVRLTSNLKLSGDGSDLTVFANAGLQGVAATLTDYTDKPVIDGTYQLTKYTDDEQLTAWNNAFEGLEVMQQAYTDYVEDDLVSDPENITNKDNNTGYQTSTDYVASGHILKIRKLSIPVKGKFDVKTGEMTLTKISEENYKQYPDGTAFDNTDTAGEQYDVFMYIPHFWYKGINDFKSQQKHTLLSANKAQPANTWTKRTGGTLGDLMYADNKGIIVANATVGKVIDESSVFGTLAACAIYRLDVEGMKQARYIGMNNASYGSIFTDADGKVLQIDTLSINGSADSPLDFKNENGDYIFRNVPAGAKWLYFTCLRNLPDELPVFGVDSTDIEALEDWVEHKSELIGVYGATIDDLGMIRSISGKVTIRGNNKSVTSTEWQYDSDGNPTNMPVTTPNYTGQDFFNLCLYRGKGYHDVDYENNKIIAILSRCYYGNRDDQSIYGYGCGSGYTTGQRDNIGKADTSKASNTPNKVWGLEGWIACNWEFMDNVGVNIPSFAEWKKNGRTDARLGNATIDHVWHINMQQYGFERTVQGINANGYDIARLKHGRYCDIIASSVNTDNSKWNTCYTACQWYNATYGCVVGRASSNASANGGLVIANAYYASSYSVSSFGARLAYCGKFANEKEICDEAV